MTHKVRIIFEQEINDNDLILRLIDDGKTIVESKNDKGALWCLMKVLVLFEQGKCGCNCFSNNILNTKNKEMDATQQSQEALIRSITEKAQEFRALLKEAEKQGLAVNVVCPANYGGNYFFKLSIKKETELVNDVI